MKISIYEIKMQNDKFKYKNISGAVENRARIV